MSLVAPLVSRVLIGVERADRLHVREFRGERLGVGCLAGLEARCGPGVRRGVVVGVRVLAPDEGHVVLVVVVVGVIRVVVGVLDDVTAATGY